MEKERAVSSPYSGKEHFVFVSYAHKDSEIVFDIITRMQHDGYRIWFDEGITPGKDWDAVLADRIGGCSLFLAFLSANYLNSANCIDELFYARDIDQTLLLVFLDETELSGGMRMRLGRTQAVFFRNYPNTGALLEKICQADEIKACCVSDTAAYGDGNFTGRETDPEEEYRKGIGLLGGARAGMDAFEAVACLKRAAALGHAEALAKLGECYQKGVGVERDMTKAAECFEEAAAAGSPAAMNSLALFCLWGLGRKKDPERAVDLYRRAAESGDAAAANNLGHCYESGTGVEPDPANAVAWYETAAKKGYAEGMNSLGLCYERGIGVPKDRDRAAEYYRQAAELGHAGAKKNLEYLGKM